MPQSFKIDSRLREEITAYCEENNLVPSNYVNSLLRRAFASDRFGEVPNAKIVHVSDIEEPTTPIEDDVKESTTEGPTTVEKSITLEEPVTIQTEVTAHVEENKPLEPKHEEAEKAIPTNKPKSKKTRLN